MLYIGQFRDIKGQLYTVKVVTNDSTASSKELTMGVPPFETEMDKSSNNIYRPAKYVSATARFRLDSDLNLYTGQAHGVKVTLYKGGTDSTDVAWTGWGSPEAYSMAYVMPREDFSLECVDGLSSLQYIKYTPVNTDKAVVTFNALLRHLLQMCDCYDKMYISTVTHLVGDTSSIIDKLCISEQNFFDEKSDTTELDDDVAWTAQDVLEHVCQFLGVTAVAYGPDVYLIDYDAIAKGINTYWCYNISDTSAATQVTLSDARVSAASMHAKNDATISHDSVYNSVKVKDSLYTYDSMIPDFFDFGINITGSSDSDLATSDKVENGMYGEVISSEAGGAQENNNMIVFIDRVYNPQKKTYGAYNFIAVKYYSNPYYKLHKYKWDNTTSALKEVAPDTINYTYTKDMYGATICRFGVTQLNGDTSSMLSSVSKIFNKELSLDIFLKENEVSSISLTDYILLNNPSAHHISNENYRQYPFLETDVVDSAMLFGGENAYILISGSYIYHYLSDDPYPIPEGEADISEGRFAMDAGDTKLMCRLQIGSLYYSGDETKGDNGWVSTASDFDILYMSKNADKKARRADATMFKSLDFVNTVYWRSGINEKGYLIKMPANTIINGIPRLTIYKPYDPNYHSTKSGDNEGQHYKHSVAFLKDFKVKAIIGDPSFSDAMNTDTEYRNVIDRKNASSFRDISMKVCTWDNKKANYSSVAVLNGDDYSWLDVTVNDALTDGEKEWTAHDDDAPSDTDGKMRQEEHLIYRIVTQYGQSAVRLSETLRNDIKPYTLITDNTLGKKMIVDSVGIDYEMGTAKVGLREMKE